MLPDAKAKGSRRKQGSRGHCPWWPSRLNKSHSVLINQVPFGYP